MSGACRRISLRWAGGSGGRQFAIKCSRQLVDVGLGQDDRGAKLDTIKEHVNERGETVYAVSASRFDISPPLMDMAAQATMTKSSDKITKWAKKECGVNLH